MERLLNGVFWIGFALCYGAATLIGLCLAVPMELVQANQWWLGPFMIYTAFGQAGLLLMLPAAFNQLSASPLRSASR